jgi:small subunit ribosomal protein S6
MNKYEAMIIIRPDLSEADKKALLGHIGDVVSKVEGKITQSSIWAERKKLYFPIKKHQEGVYYLLNFDVDPSKIKDIKLAYRLNEDILRVLITRQ